MDGSADQHHPHRPVHIVFVGAGAVGCFYASRLHHVSEVSKPSAPLPTFWVFGSTRLKGLSLEMFNSTSFEHDLADMQPL